jgi:hypothetical protein
VDFIPYFISVLDIVNDQIIKEMSDDLELQIDNLIKKIPSSLIVPVSYKYKDNMKEETYENYLF